MTAVGDAAARQRRASVWLFVGFLLHVVGAAAATIDDDGFVGTIGALMVVVGFPVFMVGCVGYARGKGYGWYVGLLGLLGIIGFVVLLAIRDKTATRNGGEAR